MRSLSLVTAAIGVAAALLQIGCTASDVYYHQFATQSGPVATLVVNAYNSLWLRSIDGQKFSKRPSSSFALSQRVLVALGPGPHKLVTYYESGGERSTSDMEVSLDTVAGHRYHLTACTVVTNNKIMWAPIVYEDKLCVPPGMYSCEPADDANIIVFYPACMRATP